MNQCTRTRGLTAMTATALVFALVAAGCSVVGFPYVYRNRHYTMTKPNSDYHQSAIRDVRTRYGDPEAEEDPAKLRGACQLLTQYAASAPEPGSFTPARDLLDEEARSACHQARAREEARRRTEEHAARTEEARREHDAQERARAAARQTEERARLTASLERDENAVATCDATEAARTARKRHADIVAQGPAATVRKTCSPRFETRTVKSECKDPNGFTRPCTQTVATQDVAGYTCPKSLDPEIVQLGLYQLDLLDSYPFPEDRSIRVRDEECDAARTRLRQTRSKLDEAGRTP